MNDNHFFKLYVPVRLIGQNDTLDLKLNNQYNSQTYNVDINFMVDTILFDPDLWIISKNSTVDLSVRNLITKKIDCYPSPCNDKLFINTSENLLKIEIIDINGIRQKSIINNKQVDMSHLASGVYFVKIFTTKDNYIKKIIKH